MDNQEIGKNIVQLRKKHGLSQRELAERAGITHSAISSIENGKVSPSVSSLQKIVNVFSLSLSEFFTFEQPSNDEVKVVIKPSDSCGNRERDGVHETGNEWRQRSSHRILDRGIRTLWNHWCGRNQTRRRRDWHRIRG